MKENQNETKEIEYYLIDHMEGETSGSIKEDVELMLAASQLHRKMYKNLKKLKNVIQKSDQTSLPKDEKFYNNLHDKVMGQLEKKLSASDRKKRSQVPHSEAKAYRY